MKIPKKLVKPYKQTINIINGFLEWLVFCILDTGREPKFQNNHLLYILLNDYAESLVAVPMLIEQGIHNPVIRESRFILEMSIKMAIQQNKYKLSIEKKLEAFKKELSSPSISLMKRVHLYLLNDELHEQFFEETGKLFGYSSKFVHLTHAQVSKRVSLIQAGRSIGKESAKDLENLNSFLERIYACAIVFMMHSVPNYVVGDWLVKEDGSTIDWYFVASKYISSIDHIFDYKHERQECLEEVIEKRRMRIKF